MNPRVIVRAQRYAAQRGVSISWLVEGYLDGVTRQETGPEAPPVLRALRGVLEGARMGEPPGPFGPISIE